MCKPGAIGARCSVGTNEQPNQRQKSFGFQGLEFIAARSSQKRRRYDWANDEKRGEENNFRPRSSSQTSVAKRTAIAAT